MSSSIIAPMARILIGIIFVAVVATVGDYVWFEIGIRHQATAGALHGALLLGSVGLVLGWIAGRVVAGLLAGIAAGVGGAAAYYAMASAASARSDTFPAMVAAWAAVWLVLAACDGRLLRRHAPRSWSEILTRGILAAVLGGLAFYAVLNVIWGAPPAAGRNYVLQFAAWMLAWAPGIVAIAGTRPK